MITWTKERIARLDRIFASINGIGTSANAYSLTLLTMQGLAQYQSALLIKDMEVIFQGSSGVVFTGTGELAGVYLCPPGSYQAGDDSEPNTAYPLLANATLTYAQLRNWIRVDLLDKDTIQSADVGIARLQDIIVPAGWALRAFIYQTGQLQAAITMNGLGFIEQYGCECR